MAPAVSPSLVGREKELERVFAFLAGIAGGAATLLLEGEAGIGKTTIWRAGVERARELGYRVLEARPAESERELAFAALADLLRDVHDDIGYLPEPQRRALRIALVLQEAAGDPPEQRAIAAALLGLLRRLGDGRPVLIAVDDTQWLDAPSTAALQFALRRLDAEPVRVLATTRPDAGQIAPNERVMVGPLSLRELDQLVRTHLGAQFLRPTLHQLEDASGGNPFYALEIAAGLLRARQLLEPGAPLPIPGSLRDVVRERLALLSPAATQAALATAALAEPTVTAVQRAIRDGVGPISEAVTAGILVREGEVLRFTHPLLAATLYEDASTGERREMHRRLAEIVDDVEDRARHLAETADGPEEELAAALEAAAASAAARGAPDAGARLAKRAVELTAGELGAAAHRRTLQWARLTLAGGDPAAAERILEDHRRVAAAGREAAEVQLELGKARLATQGTSAACTCFQHALRELDGAEEPELEATVIIELAQAYVTGETLDLSLSERVVALAERSGSADLLARALGLHAATLTVHREPPSEEFWQHAFEVERTTGELRFGGPTGAYSLATWLRGDLEESTRAEGLIAESMRKRGDPLLPQVLVGLSEARRISGDWESAEQYVDEAHDLVLQTGRDSFEPFCLLYKARIALPQGDLDGARAFVDEALAVASRLAEEAAERTDVEAMANGVFAQIADVCGRYEEAHELTAAAIEKAEQLGPLMNHARAEMVAADVMYLVALGALDEASSQLDRLFELRDAIREPALDGITLRAEGLFAAARNDATRSVALLERSVRAFEALPSPWPMQLGWSLLALGRVQRRARLKQAARDSLQRALQIFDRLGAKLWAEKARAELAQLGGRPARTGALTAAEKRIAELVASGHSNAEVAHQLFLSPKTVEWNLSKIYKKLHVRSRTELAAKVAKRQSLVR